MNYEGTWVRLQYIRQDMIDKYTKHQKYLLGCFEVMNKERKCQN